MIPADAAKPGTMLTCTTAGLLRETEEVNLAQALASTGWEKEGLSEGWPREEPR